MDPSDATQIFVLLGLLIASAFFSSAETALTTVNKVRIRSMVEEGSKRAKTVSLLIEEPGKMLSAILIGNNVVNLTASSIATSLAISLGYGTAVGIATGILTLLILIFGEITPKTLATIYSEKLSLAYAPVIYFLTQLFTPVIYVVNKMSFFILFLMRVDPKKNYAPMTENELRTIVDVSHEEGVIESEERKMITNVVDFGDSLAKDVMVPRINMAYANINMTYAELLAVFQEEKYSRLPVYSEEKDDIIGIINLKDVFFFQGEDDDFHIKDYMRAPFYTYEFKKTSELLHEMRRDSISMAIVLDEYGVTAGLITIEDLLEEIVGEIRDEYDDDEEDIITQINEKEFIADGAAKLDEINEFVGLHLDSDDYDSIAGHIIHLLDHLPEQGEQITEGNATFTVIKVEKNRIDKVKITLA